MPRSGPSYHETAAICTRGHVETAVRSARATVPPRCGECGAKILTACPACDRPIRGRYVVPGVIGFDDTYAPPRFCDRCGAPFPWLDRQGRIYELENLLEGEDLDPADALAVREQLEALGSPEIDEEEAARRWARVKRLAPGLWQSGRPILESVVSATIRAQLGL